MRYLLPLARANAQDCARLCDAVAEVRPTSRQMAELYTTYAAGNASTRELVVGRPELVLAARREAIVAGPTTTPGGAVVADARTLVAIARRASGRVAQGALDGASEGERDDARRAAVEAHAEIARLRERIDKENGHAG